jgi:hypothetical protein
MNIEQQIQDALRVEIEKQARALVKKAMPTNGEVRKAVAISLAACIAEKVREASDLSAGSDLHDAMNGAVQQIRDHVAEANQGVDIALARVRKSAKVAASALANVEINEEDIASKVQAGIFDAMSDMHDTVIRRALKENFKVPGSSHIQPFHAIMAGYLEALAFSVQRSNQP